MIDLNLFRKNIYTNSGVKPCPGYGEDGVLNKIFEVIGISANPACIEFGELRVLGSTTRSYRIQNYATATYLQVKYPQVLAAQNLFINGAVLPNPALKKAIENLKENEALVHGNLTIAVNTKSANFQIEVSYNRGGTHLLPLIFYPNNKQ